MRRAAAILALLFGCGSDLRPPDGVYTMCREVAGFSGETLELKDGRFRYWFYSDVVTGNEPAFPLTGTYRIRGDTLTLSHSQVYEPTRTIARIGDTWVLWRDDALKLWDKDRRLHPYGVLLLADMKAEDPDLNSRPSISFLKTPEMKERDRNEFNARYSSAPPESRKLLRARTLHDDPDMTVYKAAIARARDPLDPRLPAELVGLLGGDSTASFEALEILEDLYQQTLLINEAPPFLENPTSRREALQSLIDAISGARDRKALEDTLLLFLRVSGVKKMNMEVPATGIRIRLEALPSGASYGSEGTPGDDVRWLKLMPKLIPVCQAWMRSQLPK